MTTAIGIILGGAFIIWSMQPLFRKLGFWVSLDDTMDSLEDHKQRVYHNISDLEFDHAMGRLSAADFNRIRNSFAREAGLVVQKIRSEQKEEILDRIERDIARLNGKKHQPKKKREKNGQEAKFCQECGTKVPANARFCMSCGEALS